MRLYPLAVKVGLYAELMIIIVMLALPFESYGRYSRKLLEEQRVGCYWLINGKMDSIPHEAADHYAIFGKVIIAVVIFTVLYQVFDFIKPLIFR